jgi:hypothetical protein
MKGLNVETWYHCHGLDVKEHYDMYCHIDKIEGVLKVIRDAYKRKTSVFRGFVISINYIDNRFNIKSYSRLKIDNDGQGHTVVEYDILNNKECFDFKEVYKSTSVRQSLNYALKIVESDMKKLYQEVLELNGVEVG